MESLLARIIATAGCRVLPAAGLPAIEAVELPTDLEAFYRHCGGCVLFENSDCTFLIVPPAEFKRANPVIVGVAEEDGDISSSWYIVGRGDSQEYVTIDLAPSRLGRCHDSFWDRHAVAGSSPVVAWSFTDLVERMLANRGNDWYWLRPEFVSLGDAYD